MVRPSYAFRWKQIFSAYHFLLVFALAQNNLLVLSIWTFGVSGLAFGKTSDGIWHGVCIARRCFSCSVYFYFLWNRSVVINCCNPSALFPDVLTTCPMCFVSMDKDVFFLVALGLRKWGNSTYLKGLADHHHMLIMYLTYQKLTWSHRDSNWSISELAQKCSAMSNQRHRQTRLIISRPLWIELTLPWEKWLGLSYLSQLPWQDHSLDDD